MDNLKQRGAVLVVDDEPINQESLIDFLESEDWDYIVADNGQLALEALKTTDKEVKVILLDWMMPVMDGKTMLKHLKANEKLQDIPVIMQTAKSQELDKVDGLDSGAFQFLTKPYSELVLGSMIRKAFEVYDRNMAKEQAAESNVEGVRDYAFGLIDREKQKLQLDMVTLEAINDFFNASLQVESYEALTQLLIDSIHLFEFESAKSEGEPDEFKRLRCSTRLASGEEINLSDRGISSKLDTLILEKAMQDGEILRKGSYTAIPSKSGQVAILVRNTPKAQHEEKLAITIVSSLLEQFEERLVSFKAQEELRRKQKQIKVVVSSCTDELNHVKDTYQELKEKQMDLLESMESKLIETLPQLSEADQGKLKATLSDLISQSFDIFGSEQITDQKFLLSISSLNDLFSEEQADDRLKPGKMSDGKQSDVDDLLASLGM